MISGPDNCTEMNTTQLQSVDCILYSWGRVLDDENHDTSCNPKPYTSSVCRQQLLAWQECAVGTMEDLFLDLTIGELSQLERERDASQFLYFLRELCNAQPLLNALLVMDELTHSLESFGSDYCQKAAGLLICQSYFPLCDCKSGYLYSGAREECERISMVECEEEWMLARQYGIPLPNCTNLPEEDTSEGQYCNTHSCI